MFFIKLPEQILKKKGFSKLKKIKKAKAGKYEVAKMIKTELDIFNMARVVMDTYKGRYEKAKKKREERFRNLNANYKPGSPLFLEERNKIVPDFEAEIAKARNDLMMEFEDSLMKLRAIETAKVAVISNETKTMMSVLDCLKDRTVSLDEYTVLTQHYGGKTYWVDRFLETLADKCGIMDSMVQPGLGTKLEILKTLEQNVREYIDGYDGENKCFPVTSSDKYIYKMEESYTNSYSNVRLDSREQAKRMISKALNEGSSLDRSFVLANMLRTSTPDIQDEMLSILAEKDPAALHDPTMQFTGVKNVVDRFIKTDGELVKAASVAMEKADNAKSHQERIGILWDNFDNRHLRKKIEERIAATKDEELKDSYENMKQIKKEQEQESRANKGE